MKIHIKTYGCQMNERDSEALSGMLTQAGHIMVESEESADVLLFNTCSVREQAERKAKGKIGYMKKLKAKNPELVIGALGCMAQRLGDKLLDELPHLDFVLGTGQLHTLVPLIESIKADRRQVAAITESPEVLNSMGSHFRSKSDLTDFKAQIAITRGCNRFCSYCIVPYVRGREISREMNDVLDEARALVADGAKEIMLLGQNVAAYGWGGNINPPPSGISPFAELLEELDRIPGLLRIRFTSPYPTYFNDKLISTIASSRAVCHNIHLPLQSGSDRVLSAMNRQYTANQYRAVVAALKQAMPDVTFSTDVIVGFPGESDEDFRQTRELMNEVGYDNSFIFKYSPRPGAKSAEGEDSVPQEVKEERNAILLADLKRRVSEVLQTQVGSIQEVLVEGTSPRNPERWSGRTGTNRVIHFLPTLGVQPGSLRQVKITRAGSVSLFGELLPE
ncbi:MAG: tRNA (N6-isopentenyl adenosine(37)-C2)-methylthiotransferase MiaB [Victivallales bacterium]|jgi:tRNA-2-methylthio-N6-dimethylallyladenosine synthase|nr:tRNA (N6-isopentenyl adenosine(37)-C2)-methylthiotransferase MiaB [Victivallales bacterium]